MRIGVIGPQRPDNFAQNILVSLRSMGHDAFPLGAVKPRIGSDRVNQVAQVALRSVTLDTAVQKRLVRRAAALSLDLIITVEGDLFPGCVRAFQQAGARVVLWFPDHVANLGRQLMLLSAYDAIF